MANNEYEKQLAEAAKAAGIQEDAALALRGEFSGYYDQIVTLRESAAMVTKPEDTTHQKLAREVRLGLRKARCEVENTRKGLKAESLARGKAIDGFANVLKYLCEPVEAKLLQVEQYAERIEAERVARVVAERSHALTAVEGNTAAYNLATMDDATFDSVLDMARKAQADRIEAERKIEAERVAKAKAEAEERERMRVENEKLKKEAAEQHAKIKAEREAREEAERKQAEAARREKALAEAAIVAERKAREEAERKQAEAARREKALAEAAIVAERKAREEAERAVAEAQSREFARIAGEKSAVAAKLAAEAKAKADAEKAPDAEKIREYVRSIYRLELPAMSTEAGRRTMEFVADARTRFAERIEKFAQSM